jgi:hypothetical protein
MLAIPFLKELWPHLLTGMLCHKGCELEMPATKAPNAPLE